MPRNIFSTVIFPQGFFIFILHVLRNGDVHAEFDRKIQNWKISRSIASSRETHQHSSSMWTNKVIISDTHELNNKRNETISRPGSGFDNPLVLRQQRSITPVDAWLSRDRKVDEPRCNGFMFIVEAREVECKLNVLSEMIRLYTCVTFSKRNTTNTYSRKFNLKFC